jgi:hypothetical protein
VSAMVSKGSCGRAAVAGFAVLGTFCHQKRKSPEQLRGVTRRPSRPRLGAPIVFDRWPDLLFLAGAFLSHLQSSLVTMKAAASPICISDLAT